MKRVLATLLVSAFAAAPASADISRTEVLDRAKAYAYYPWTSSADNETASCATGYDSAFVPGDYLGVSYDWGGFDSLFEFDQKIEDGYGAGSPAGGDVYWCTTGVDCSGFISQTWGTNQKYGTSTLHQISSAISVGSVLPGDVFNDSGNHVVMWSHNLANGTPFFIEAVFYNVHENAYTGWSWVDGFISRRFDSVTGTSVSAVNGSLNQPIDITSFPYNDSRDTSDSDSDLLDGCGVSPSSNVSGPEFVYRVELDQPGQLTASVSDDAGVDIDVHIYESWNTSDCFARNDSTVVENVGCGTYYIVADTFRSASNGDQSGAYNLTVDFTPNGSTCGTPDDFDPEGGLGDDCAYPGNGNLPFCNPTLGGDVCLYSSSDSFCSKPCAESSDCSDMPSGGCCADIGDGELYCLTAALCEDDGGGETPEGGEPGDPGDPGDPEGGSPPSGGAPPLLDKDSGGCAVGNRGGSAAWFTLLILGLFRLRRRRG